MTPTPSPDIVQDTPAGESVRDKRLTDILLDLGAGTDMEPDDIRNAIAEHPEFGNEIARFAFDWLMMDDVACAEDEAIPAEVLKAATQAFHQTSLIADDKACIRILAGYLLAAPSLATPPARSVPDGQGVKVKALEWEHHPHAHGQVRAPSPIGLYRIVFYGDYALWGFAGRTGLHLDNRTETIEAAKVAAQADHEARILSALTPSDGEREPEGETGPAVADGLDAAAMRVWASYRGVAVHVEERWRGIDEVDKAPWRAAARAALTVSPSPSERDQHQGETLREIPFEAIQAAWNALQERFIPAHNGKKGKPDLTRGDYEVIYRAMHAALSTPKAVPVAEPAPVPGDGALREALERALTKPSARTWKGVDGFVVIPASIARAALSSPVPGDAQETYYTKGKDADWFEGLSDKDAAWALTCAAQDLNDTGLGDAIDRWMPHNAMLSGAADRINRLLASSPDPARGAVEPVAWIETATIEKRWQEQIVAVNPEYVENNGAHNFTPLFAHSPSDPETVARLERERDEAIQQRDVALSSDIMDQASATITTLRSDLAAARETIGRLERDKKAAIKQAKGWLAYARRLVRQRDEARAALQPSSPTDTGKGVGE